MDNVDLDRIVDYKAEYTAAMSREKLRISGDSILGLCPFHQEKNPSFSVDLKTGKWNCFTEGESGNFITFYAKLHNIDTGTAYKEILEKYGVSREAPKKEPKKNSGSGLGSYSLEQYSKDKQLPADFLRDICRTDTGRDRDGTTFLRISYADATGQEITYRKRYAKKEFRWRTGSKGKIHLYGEWRLESIRAAGWAILVEGESDTQSLWYMGLPAIGVAGATLFKPEQVELLQGLKLYVHKEPDQGGDTFTAKIYKCLRDGDFTGTVYRWDCAHLDAKDPSDVYLAHGQENGSSMIREALAAAELIDLEKELLPEVIPGAPAILRQPEAWIYSESGISSIDPKTMTPTCVCRTPIILTQRLKSIETGEEKMEVAFKRDGQWTSAIYPRDAVFSSRGILDLSRLGCTVTSENARQVVKFLGALEAENIDLIPKADATSTFGWQPGKRFLPGRSENLVLDIDPSQRSMAAAYCQNGTLEGWLAHMAPHRERDKFRFILAASFAAPLLRIVKQRIFFVYNWGGSKGGKTATMKAALSAWGDPERLMISFNTTIAGLERTAAFYCDLPLGIDERQQAGDKQGLIQQLVYMVSGGKGKIRAAKNGGLQTTYQWRTVALATGEEPLSTDTTMTGVSTRVLEIYGGPFEDETAASLMHQQAGEDCGWAGPAFIERLVQTDERQIIDAYEEMHRYVRDISEGKNGSHIAGISVVALADALIDYWFFGARKEAAWDRAKRMAKNILIDQVEGNATDVNENAVQFIVDWVLSNKAYFGTKAIGTCLGFSSDTGNTVYIFPSMLNQALSKAGYSPRKTMKYMAEQGLIATEVDRSTGKKQYSVRKWFDNRTSRFVEFYIGKIAESKDPVEAAEEEMDESEPTEAEINAQEKIGGFTEIEDGDGSDPLPF
ncbi:MAG: DUF927 domain-containing protein [Oscillospiraceae bacterium]|nr:DUF927 domain-containing protein [Oscillospiraceae bacterium]